MSPSNGTTSGGNANDNNKNFIEHQVSNMDTLAGVAIKYGVEVADIKRLNGLATDLQMFALKTLLIPLPGRHPPSPIMSTVSASPRGNNLDKAPAHPCYSKMFESIEPLRLKPTQQKVSPAMSTLRKYYGLLSSNHKGSAAEGTELAVYRTGSSDYLDEGLLAGNPLASGTAYHNLKSRNFSNDLSPEDATIIDYMHFADAVSADGENFNEKSVRRRQKSESDFRTGTPKRLLKEANGGGSSDFSPVTGKGLAMRPKSASRTKFTETEPGWLNSIPVGLGDSIISDALTGVRKSSSTPSLHSDQDNDISSVCPTSKWGLKPDLQALSTAAITIPIFDGLPKPGCGRRSKTALD